MQIQDALVEEFIAACLKSKTIENLVNNSSDIFIKMGFDWMGFRYVPDAGSFEHSANAIIPAPELFKDWEKENLEKYTYHNDPFEIYVLKSGSSEWTGDMVNRDDFQSKEQRAFSKITTHHSGHSLIIPIYGPRRSRGYFYLPNKNLMQKPNVRDMAFMEHMCALFFRRYSALSETFGTSGEALTLTPREHQVLQHIPLGHSNREIADIMNISIHTVNDYMKELFFKLDVSGRIGACERAFTLDLID